VIRPILLLGSCVGSLALLGLASSTVPASDRLGPTAAGIPAEYFGIHLHRADTTTAWPPVRFGAWRSWDSGVGWRSIQPERGAWHFQQLDRLVDLAERNGVDALITFGATPGWAAARPDEPSPYGTGGFSEPADMVDWETFVRTVALRYRGRVHHYELWNEPAFADHGKSDGTFFTGSTANMVKMACSAQRILHEVDPGVRLLTPGFVGPANRLVSFLEAGGKDCTDIPAFHFYEGSPEAMLPSIRAVRSGLERIGWGDRELWNTETGYEILGSEARHALAPSPSSIDENQAAEYVPRVLVLAAAAGISRFYFYAWEDLISPDGSLNLAGRAMATSVRWLRGTRVHDCATEDDIVWSCRLSRDGRAAWLVWNVRGDSNFEIPANWPVHSYESADGSAGDIPGATATVGRLPMLLKSEARAWTP
jgi:hypothetical protein